MQLSADLRKALLTGTVITVCSVIASVLPVHIWLQFDPVIDTASVYVCSTILPAIIAPSCSFVVLRTRMKAEQLARENHRLANSDVLTGLPNRRAFFTAAAGLKARALAGEGALVCAIADIDNFKRINDEFGHDAGDSVLKSVGTRMAETPPPEGIMARLGGEEFAFAGLCASHAAARAYCDAVVAAVGAQDCVHGDVHLCVTISLGFTQAEDQDTTSAMLSRSDHALYRAKHAGKNCAVAFEDAARPAVPKAMAG